jgi:AraC-like DNA-binding protein
MAMATRIGLSPSHFAKKFRLSTGLSFHRFVNRRRIQASLTLLKDQSLPLTHVALELGLSSQSHLTRLFSELTGMPPARYRKQVKRVGV